MSAKKLGLAIVLAAGLATSGAAQANFVQFTFWEEAGDAGGLDNPQDVGRVANGIKGNIGGVINGDKDEVDVFRFYWLDPDGTGQMQVTYLPEPNSSGALEVSLYTSPTAIFRTAVTLSVNGEITWTGVSPGTYLFMVQTAQDPPFSFSLTGPTTAEGQLSIAPAPEPATLTLLGLGLASLGFSRRRAH